MSVEFLQARLRSFGSRPALATEEGITSYSGLCSHIDDWRSRLQGQGIGRGSCVAFAAGFRAEDVSLFLALALEKGIAVPCTPTEPGGLSAFSTAAHAHVMISRNAEGNVVFDWQEPEPHPLLEQLHERGEAGLVLFTSGSTGVPKAALLSLDRQLARHVKPRQALRSLAFLDSSHIGGVNTLLHTVCHGGCLAEPKDRSPAVVCAALAKHRVELLPTSPTFLNLLLMSDQIGLHDLSALRVITYGTECMPQATLTALAMTLPHVRLKQTYGSTELGILPTRSDADETRWMNVGGQGFELEVRDGRLFARGKTQMLGYLNAKQPFDDQGWYDTGDLVEEKHGMIQIVGRASEVINVGGQKVFPSEVESCLLEAENVFDAVVEGRRNAVTGQVVFVRVILRTPEDADMAEARLLEFCRARLEEYKLPALFQFTTKPLHSERFKRRRQVAI